LIGLGLNFTPWGYGSTPILASVSAFIVAASVVAWYRAHDTPADERFAIVVNFEMDFKGMPIVDRALTIGIVVMLVASVVVPRLAVATPELARGSPNLQSLVREAWQRTIPGTSPSEGC